MFCFVSFCFNATKSILLSLTLMYFPVLLKDLSLGTGKALPQQELGSAKWFIDLNVEAICKRGGRSGPDWLMLSLWLAKYAFHL